MKLRDLLFLASGVAAASQVSALSLGSSQGNVQLGSPIDLVFQVQADEGHTAQSSCITADVWMGDTALDPSRILVTALDSRVRVQTTTPVYEPLITLKLHAGCTASMARSYTLLADPPKTLAASVEPIDLNTIQIPPLQAAPTAQAQAGSKSTPTARTPQRKLERQTAPALPPTSSAATNRRPTGDTATPPAAPLLPSTAAADSAKPRLRMTPLDGVAAHPESLVPPTVDIAAAESAALITAARAAADAEALLLINANAERLEAMEQQLQAMHKQLSSNQTEIAGLHSQLLQAQQDASLPTWVYMLLGLLALALASIAWLVQRLKQERVNTQLAWADTVLAVEATEHGAHAETEVPTPPPAWTPAAATAADSPAAAAQPTPGVEAAIASQPVHAPRHPASASLDTPPSPALDTASKPRPSTHTSSVETAARPEVLTAQALFAVQEHAEFYASIGENNQAIEILQSHIAKHEASSPLAYIELLQLLYRLSRTEAFEKVREKFQRYFNVQVPTFLDFAHQGDDLWSGHPEVLQQIEAQWATDAVQALLRDFIVRQHPSQEVSSEIRFELSAFDDLLMLYNVATTTPASSRGELPGHTLSAPAQLPLPKTKGDPTPPAVAGNTMPRQDARLDLDLLELDLLSAASAPAPLAPPQPYTDSPFQTPHPFSPNEALVDGLSLDWSMPAATKKVEQPQHDLSLENLNLELKNFPFDEATLPEDRPK